MYLPDQNVMELTADYGYQSFILMTVFAIISFILFLVSLALCWIKYKNLLQEGKHSSFIDGYVDSMVHAYFYDYLKKTIPDQGTGGLYDKIMTYKEIENLTDDDFPLHKIFIIICASGFIPINLEEIDNERIKSRKDLESVLNSVRPTSTNGCYTTAVYKVKHYNLKDHITIATGPPLLTLLNASKEDPGLKTKKKQIIKMFYNKLSKKLAENTEFAKSYELIFYNNDPNKPPTLADEIILRHIDKGLVTLKEAIEFRSSTDSMNEETIELTVA